MGRLLGFHPPQFSEEAAWLPAWLQPSTMIREATSNLAFESPSGQGLEELGCLQQSISTIENGNLSDDGRCKSLCLFLSGEDNSPMFFPSCSSNHEVKYHLRLSLNEESQYSVNPISSTSQPERSEFNQAPLVQQPEANVISQEDTCEVNYKADEAYVVPSQKRGNSVITQKGINPKVDIRSRKVDINDAIELAVAASEALTIHEVVKDDHNIASVVLEAAIRVKQARLQHPRDTLVEDSNEVDHLSDLDELTMEDAYEDVGLTVTGHGDLSGYGSVSHVNDSYALENYISNSKQKCYEPGCLVVDSGFISIKQQHKQVDNDNIVLKSGSLLESFEGRTENADLACDIDPVFNCSVEQANFCTTEVGLHRGEFASGDLTSSRTILRSSLQSGSSGNNEREEDKMNKLVTDRFQSRWFGGWTWKKEVLIPAVTDDKCKRNVPQLLANETSSLSESADIAPDMNSCIHTHDKECKTVTQSSIAPEATYEKASNNGNLLSDDVAVEPTYEKVGNNGNLFSDDVAVERTTYEKTNSKGNLLSDDVAVERTTYEKTNNKENLLSDDVAVECTYDKASNNGKLLSDDVAVERTSYEKTSNNGNWLSDDVAVECTYDNGSNDGNMLSDDVAVSPPMDPLCSVVPCSFTSNTSCHLSIVSQNCKHQCTTTEANLDNLKRVSSQSADFLIKKVNGENSPTIRRRVAPLKTYSMLYPTCDPYLDKEQTRAPDDCPSVLQSQPIDFRDNKNGHNKTAKEDVRKVESNCKSFLVPRRKRVRFSEPEINYRRVKKFKTPQTKVNGSLLASRISSSRGFRDSKKMLFQDLKFLLTGFSVKKHKQIKNIIRKNGGIIMDDIPSISKKRCSKYKCKVLPLILCPKRLLTTKFLYGCAVNACILKVKWVFDSVDEGSILPPKKYMILKEHVTQSCMVIGKPIPVRCYIFDNIAIMLHGKHDFCTKMAKVIKHGGGLVFKTLHWLVKSLESKKVSVGVIVVEDENGISRQLKQCVLEQEIPMMPFNWMVNSLYAGRLLPSPQFKLPEHSVHLELSEEI